MAYVLEGKFVISVATISCRIWTQNENIDYIENTQQIIIVKIMTVKIIFGFKYFGETIFELIHTHQCHKNPRRTEILNTWQHFYWEQMPHFELSN